MLISKRALRRLSTTRKATHVFSKITNFSESDSVPKISVYADLTCKNARIMNSPFNLTAPSGMKTNYTKKCFIVLNGLSCVIVRMCIVNIYIFFFLPLWPVALQPDYGSWPPFTGLRDRTHWTHHLTTLTRDKHPC